MATWNGADDAKRPVPDGIYQVRLTTHDDGGRAFIRARRVTVRHDS